MLAAGGWSCVWIFLTAVGLVALGGLLSFLAATEREEEKLEAASEDGGEEGRLLPRKRSLDRRF